MSAVIAAAQTATTCGALSSSTRRSLARSTRRHEAAAPARVPARRVLPTVKAVQQEDEFAIFRFTLGIPGFEDEDIPKVVGLLGAALLVVNHLASANPSDAQVRDEGARERVRV
jgi:hypothetical protein